MSSIGTVSGTPYYTITPCCPELGTTTLFFNIPDGIVPDGIYEYTGPSDEVNGITFEEGYCYTINYQAAAITTYPFAPSSTLFDLIDGDCDINDSCTACGSKAPFAYEVYACCDSNVTVTINLDTALTSTFGVYKYTGLTSPLLIGSVEFITGQCYQINYVGDTLENIELLSSEFQFNGPSCGDAESCPECPTTQQYLKFDACCGDAPLYFQIPSGGFNEGLYNYVGTPTLGIKNTCYIITINDVGVAPIDDIDYSLLPEAPIFIEDVTYNTISLSNLDCEYYANTNACPTCIKPCYTLYNCDGEFRNTTVDLSAYAGTLQPISIYNSYGPIDGTWYVFLNTGKCNNAVNDIQVNDISPEPCVCRCFIVVTDSGVKGRYLDCDGNIQKIIVNTSFCSLVYPIVDSAVGPYEIVEGDACIDDVCPIKCYELTECTTKEIITSQSQSLAQYFISGAVIELVGHPGCWQVTSDAAEDCSCPVDVTVTIVHEDCPTCIGIIAYKLTNCQNDDIKYTYDDLSEYIVNGVGLTLRTDCGCYEVEQIDFQPTSTSPIVIISSFEGCPECLTQYYELTDCNGLEDPIYTYTDLSSNLGLTIVIKGCDTCWEVTETDTPVNPGAVTVMLSFLDCPSCTPPLPCLCNRITNYSAESKEYEYIDCNDESVLITLAAGQTSGKICLKRWVIDYPDTDNLEVFGECQTTETIGIYVCPETRPKRKIKPGYSVPTCDTDKWEKITCRSSEILYKEVMRLRYGMSNCCPEDDEKWLIKKELIDLAALVDSNYICKPVQTCGCAPSSCGCGCSSTLKTCSSQ